MKNHQITRRKILAASGGAFLATGLLPVNVFGKEAKAKDLIFRTAEPRNGEPELAKLAKSWLTPTELFYVRSHAPNPVIDPKEFRLRVEGRVQKARSFSLQQLQSFRRQSTTATLTCAGNRRAEFNRGGKVGGVQWDAGAIGNATWAGASLADILSQVGVTEGAKHVWFEGLDQIPKGDGIIPFGGSIPIEKAMMANTVAAPLLAYSMNGAPLTPDHGFPLRTVVPGYIGARSVKWLGKIVVSDRPSPNHYLATAYKIVTKTEPIDWAEAAPIYRFPINAAICTPAPNSSLSEGPVEVRGYVLPTGRLGSEIENVFVSADNGRSWKKAEMTGENMNFCWQLWKATVAVTKKTKKIIVKATDSSGGFMPGRVPWNAKGYLQNSWYQLPVRVG